MALHAGSERLAEEKLATDLTEVRTKTRMRLGVVAGVVAVGLFQTHFDIRAGEGTLVMLQSILRAAFPVIAIGVIGSVVVWGIARRDTQRIRAAYEGKVFRIPIRKSAKRPR